VFYRLIAISVSALLLEIIDNFPLADDSAKKPYIDFYNAK
jgi:hypothetical protein